MISADMVKEMLENFGDMQTLISALEYRIATFSGLSEDETIDAMSFSKPQGDRVQRSGYSDRTAKIALNYKEYMESENAEELAALCREYLTCTKEMRTLEYCMSMLPQKLELTLRGKYMEGMTYQEIYERYEIPETSIRRYQKKAFHEIQKMLNTMSYQPLSTYGGKAAEDWR